MIFKCLVTCAKFLAVFNGKCGYESVAVRLIKDLKILEQKGFCINWVVSLSYFLMSKGFVGHVEVYPKRAVEFYD